MPYWTKLEKAALTGLASIALLMFFFPLLVIQAPIVGERDVSGYDIFSKVRQFSHQVDDSSTQPKTPSQTQEQAPEAAAVPLSLKLAWLIPVNVTVAFILAVIVFIGALSIVRISSISAVLGAAFSVVAVAHITIANSDLHSWLAASFKSSSEELKGNPFAPMAEQFGNLMLNAFRIRPGAGLCVLASAMVLAALVAKSRVLARFRVVSAEQSASAGN